MDRSVLQRATQCDDEPTPGYLLEEIVRMSLSAEACPQIEDFLVKGLGQNFRGYDARVKLKMLRIVKHVCEKGNSQFRRSFQKKVGLLKAFLCYRSTPDPLRGDAPDKEVREEAQKCIRSIFGNEALPAEDHNASQFYRYNETNAQNSTGSQWCGSKTKITGLGNSEWTPIPDTGSHHVGAGSQMYPGTVERPRNMKIEGFGNTPYNPQMRENKHQDIVSQAMSLQAENFVSGLGQAASAVAKYLPKSLKSHIGMTDKLPFPAASSMASKYGSTGYDRHANSYASSYQDRYRFSGFPDGTSYSSSGVGGVGMGCSKDHYLPPEDRLRPSGSFFRPLPSQQATSTDSSGVFKFASQNNPQSTPTTATDLEGEHTQMYAIVSSIETLCQSTISHKPAPPRSTLATFVRNVMTDSQWQLVVPLLVCKLDANLKIETVSNYTIRPATTWQTKYRVVCALLALADPMINTDDQKRQIVVTSIKEISLEALRQLAVSTPKCREIVDEFCERLNVRKLASNATNQMTDLFELNDYNTSSLNNFSEIEEDSLANGSSGDQRESSREVAVFYENILANESSGGCNLLGDLLDDDPVLCQPQNDSSPNLLDDILKTQPSLSREALMQNGDTTTFQSSRMDEAFRELPKESSKRTGLFSGLSLEANAQARSDFAKLSLEQILSELPATNQTNQPLNSLELHDTKTGTDKVAPRSFYHSTFLPSGCPSALEYTSLSPKQQAVSGSLQVQSKFSTPALFSALDLKAPSHDVVKTPLNSLGRDMPSADSLFHFIQ